jgi:ferredoxin-NADP reductase/MOSC domain-containing protein YiiM
VKLLNFSTGQVRTIQVGSDVIRTAHIKAPVAEPWIVTPNGALGDERAVHPDKIYAFARTGYDHWGDHLAIDPRKWPDGFFGENLTLDDLDEKDVRVGDVFLLGDAVKLVVSGARTPCVKLAWRLSQPRAFQKIFAKSRRTGAYFGVLADGIVKPGDTLRRIHHDPTMPSIADVCDFVADHDLPPLEPLRRLLSFDGLSPTLRLLLGGKLEAAEQAAAQPDDAWQGWRRFEIDEIVAETSDIRSVYLRAIDGGPLAQPRPGQSVTVRLRGEDGARVTRTWSLSHHVPGMDRYRLTVRLQNGAGSTALHGATRGAQLELRSPRGDFTLDVGSFRPLVLIAAGIGITPLHAMLQAHLARPGAPPVYLIYGARTPDQVALEAELRALAAAHPHFRLEMVYSQEDQPHRARGRIDPPLIRDVLADLHILLDGRRIDLPWHEGDMYLCGPDDFCVSITEALVAQGANPDHIRYEHFQAAAAVETDLEQATVHFRASGISAIWRADDEISLLELAEQNGAGVESECRAGSCLTCRTRIIEGDMTAALPDGSGLLCIGRPKTGTLVLDC